MTAPQRAALESLKPNNIEVPEFQIILPGSRGPPIHSIFFLENNPQLKSIFTPNNVIEVYMALLKSEDWHVKVNYIAKTALKPYLTKNSADLRCKKTRWHQPTCQVM